MYNLYNLFIGRVVSELTHNLISQTGKSFDLMKQKVQCSVLWISLKFKEPPGS